MLLMNEFKSYSELTSYCEKILRNLFLANITGRYPVNILVKEPFCPRMFCFKTLNLIFYVISLRLVYDSSLPKLIYHFF